VTEKDVREGESGRLEEFMSEAEEFMKISK
jgi:hypothetical protein